MLQLVETYSRDRYKETEDNYTTVTGSHREVKKINWALLAQRTDVEDTDRWAGRSGAGTRHVEVSVSLCAFLILLKPNRLKENLFAL